MRILFDTSVLVAAVVRAHPLHERALPWLKRAQAGEFTFLVASHTLAELYAVLTALPVAPRILPHQAWRIVKENVLASAEVIALSPADYASVISELADSGLAGGVVYAALIARAATLAGADQLLTFDPDHFKQLLPGGQTVIAAP